MCDVITIDGPTGCGKSTVSRILALKLGYRCLDTGAMYRAVALAISRSGAAPENEERVAEICNTLDIEFAQDGNSTKVYLNNEDITLAIRQPVIDLAASKVSAISIVREAMVKLQQKIGEQGSLVAEGRDMGTVVFPHANHKFYLDASIEVRVQRRFLERQARGEKVEKTKVREDLIKRDQQDMGRALSPLRPASDAKIIDTTRLSPEGVVKRIKNEIHMQERRRFV